MSISLDQQSENVIKFVFDAYPIWDLPNYIKTFVDHLFWSYVKLFWNQIKGLKLVFLPCFLHDISKKILLTSHSIDWPNFVIWLSLLLEIPGIMCIQKESSRGVLRKRCSENIQQTYRRTSMSKCNFNKVVLHSPVNLLHIFRTPFPNSFSERRLLCIVLIYFPVCDVINYRINLNILIKLCT